MEVALGCIKRVDVKNGMHVKCEIKKDEIEDVGDECVVRLNPTNTLIVRLVCLGQ